MEKREEHICYNCFHKYADEKVCPYCGFHRNDCENEVPYALPVGSVLNGKFIIGRVLGYGQYGITYIAQDWETKQRVAVKEFFPKASAKRKGKYTVVPVGEYTDFRNGMRCFQEEANNLAEFVQNPNIVHVYSYFEENETAYYVMEYVEGISFAQYVEEQGRMPWEEAVTYLLQILDALSIVHGKGILHRDITPENILITSDKIVKLINFGFVGYFIGNRSQDLEYILRPEYKAKEQYSYREKEGSYTDIYSLAATFYMVLTGKPPIESIDRIKEDHLKPLGQFEIELPKHCEQAIMKGLAVQSSDRFQSMEEFKIALSGQTILDEKDGTAGKKDIWQKYKKIKPGILFGLAGTIVGVHLIIWGN